MNILLKSSLARVSPRLSPSSRIAHYRTFAFGFLIFVGGHSATAQGVYTTPYTITTLAGADGVYGATDGTGSAAKFFLPTGIAVDGSGTLYLADLNNNTIRKITAGGVVSTLAGTPLTIGSANGISTAALFFHPNGVAVDSAQNVYVADTGNGVIRKITPTGSVSTLAGTAGLVGSTDGTGASARFNAPLGVAVDRDNNVIVADTGNWTIRKVSPAGVVTTLAGTAGLSGSADGTGVTARFGGSSGGPHSVALDGANNIFVLDNGNQTVRKITPSGVVTTLAGGVGLSGNVDAMGSAARFFLVGAPTNPQYLASDASGNVFVADTLSVRKITPAGVVSTVAGSYPLSGHLDGTGSTARFTTLSGMAVGPDGTIYMTDTARATVRVGKPPPSALAITAQPVSQSLPPGGSVTLSVTAVGTGTLTYQWLLNGLAIVGATTSTYNATGAGSYSVTVSDAVGSVTSNASMVSAAPVGGAPSRFSNLSARAVVGTGENVQIAGFIISGTSPKKILVRANGPALTGFGVVGVLGDPVLSLFNSAGLVAENDDWSSEASSIASATSAAGATPFAAGSKDAALAITLSPGAYTAIVSGKGGTTGVALVEVFELP